MNATYATSDTVRPAPPAETRRWGLVTLRLLLLVEAALTLAVAIGLSILAADAGRVSGRGAEDVLRFAAAGALVVAVAAAITARGVRRARPWSWTSAALLQVTVAAATAGAWVVAGWHPSMLAGVTLAGVVLLALSITSVRRELDQH